MYETTDDLRRLQLLLDDSYRLAGSHLRGVFPPERRVTAEQLAERLTGVRIVVVATVASDGRPFTGAVDGLFYRGEFWFGSAPDSLRFRHLRRRPHVSLTYAEGETFAVTAHGQAQEVDLDHPDRAGFRALCTEVYGEEWEEWGPPAAYARVEAERLFAGVLPG